MEYKKPLTALQVACEAAKNKPMSYYSEPFKPHQWVLDAMENYAIRMGAEKDKLLQEEKDYRMFKHAQYVEDSAKKDKKIADSLLLYQNQANTIIEKDKEIERLKAENNYFETSHLKKIIRQQQHLLVVLSEAIKFWNKITNGVVNPKFIDINKYIAACIKGIEADVQFENHPNRTHPT